MCRKETIFSLKAVVAGAKYRGEFDERRCAEETEEDKKDLLSIHR